MSARCLFAFLAFLAISPNTLSRESTDEVSNPIPKAISAGAQDYYRNLAPRPAGSIDVENPKALAFTREFLGRIFLANAEQLGIPYELEPAAIEGIEAYWIRGHNDESGKALIYLHGGGYILGSAKANVALPVRINAYSGIPVLSVEYRLAPEHKFPAGLMDALGAYRWLLDNNFDAGSIGVFGDSAGGGLVLALALATDDENLPGPGALAVLSPSTDLTRSGDTQTTLATFDPILGSGIGTPPHVYAGDVDLRHPLISPVYGDFRGLGPLLIQVGTRERLLSASVRLARRAREAGVDVTLDVWEGMWHVWQDHPTIPEAEQASKEISAFFVSHLR